MTEEQARQLLSENKKRKRLNFFREIGVSNVHKRLQYEFGEDYGLRVESRLSRIYSLCPSCFRLRRRKTSARCRQIFLQQRNGVTVMVQLLIVDDEPLVQIGIRSMLNWESIGIEIAGTATNGGGRHMISFWKSIRKL